MFNVSCSTSFYLNLAVSTTIFFTKLSCFQVLLSPHYHISKAIWPIIQDSILPYKFLNKINIESSKTLQLLNLASSIFYSNGKSWLGIKQVKWNSQKYRRVNKNFKKKLVNFKNFVKSPKKRVDKLPNAQPQKLSIKSQ